MAVALAVAVVAAVTTAAATSVIVDASECVNTRSFKLFSSALPLLEHKLYT